MSLRKTWAIVAICLCSVNLTHAQEAGDMAPPMPANPDAPDHGPVDGDAGCGDAGGYDKGCCDVCDVCCGPQITFRLSAVYMERTDNNGRTLVTADLDATDPTTIDAAIGAGDFDYDWEPGVDASLIYDLGCGRQTEVRGLWLDEHSANAGFGLTATADTVININTVDPTPLVIAEGADVVVGAAAQSELYSLEWNMRQQAGCTTFLYGLRYINFEDDLGIGVTATDVEGTVLSQQLGTFSTDNHLLGAQIGAEQGFCLGGWSTTVTGRAGLYWNDQETDARFLMIDDLGESLLTADAHEDELAFVAELGINSRYAVSCNSSIVFGYQLLWLDQVAVATDQVAATDSLALVNGSANGLVDSTVDSDGDVFYHGFNLGIEILR